jgi:alpha-glucosidase (family GH31 glycosyl hydrolase)
VVQQTYHSHICSSLLHGKRRELELFATKSHSKIPHSFCFYRTIRHFLRSKRREPWVFGEPWTGRLRSAVKDRYSLLPYWYTLFAAGNANGVPSMRPMWLEFPHDELVFAMDDQVCVIYGILYG